MELRHLRYFVAVAVERHFGRAALRLHIAQLPLSQQIRQLEAELGVQLLSRTTRRIELAPAGERYLDRARPVLAALDDAGAEAERIASGAQGHVAIGFTCSATYEVLPARAVISGTRTTPATTRSSHPESRSGTCVMTRHRRQGQFQHPNHAARALPDPERGTSRSSRT